jgi:predicted alpha/beta hydrolase family esterase
MLWVDRIVDRQRMQQSPGPILFICHGLGGIVLKQVCTRRDL